jgi:hypothetical protein
MPHKYALKYNRHKNEAVLKLHPNSSISCFISLLDSIQCQLNLAYSHSFKIHLNIILPSMSRVFKAVFLLHVFHQNFVSISLAFYVPRLSLPKHSYDI